MTLPEYKVLILTDCCEDDSLEINETQTMSINEIRKVKRDLSKTSDVFVNPSKHSQLIAISKGKLLSLTVDSNDFTWKDI